MSPVSVGFDVMAAAVVVAVDQHVAHAGFAHLAEGDLLRDVAVELAKYPEVGPGIIGRVVGKIQRKHLARRRYAHSVGKWDR